MFDVVYVFRQLLPAKVQAPIVRTVTRGGRISW